MYTRRIHGLGEVLPYGVRSNNSLAFSTNARECDASPPPRLGSDFASLTELAQANETCRMNDPRASMLRCVAGGRERGAMVRPGVQTTEASLKATS